MSENKNPMIATVCSHTSLQIFDGARKEGFETLGICLGKPPRFYDAFPRAKPDKFFSVSSYQDIVEKTPELIEKDAIIIPHGSFVEYLGASEFARLEVPSFGNKLVLEWESDRRKEREWLTSAGVPVPAEYSSPDDARGPVIVKYHGAKGGRGFFIAKNRQEIEDKLDTSEEYVIQEFVLGTRYYLHFFYSPLRKVGYRVGDGTLELLGIDRRIESNIDELYKIGGSSGIDPSFVVTGNLPMVLRESLLPKVFELGERVVERSIELFGGMIGPFCLETICTDTLEFKVFEISARIVAGTNLFVSGSPYSDMIEPGLSTGRRIAQEIRLAIEMDRLGDVLS
ncbi:MAG TPA: formate--phosphoribosylaminoimidazolecarboxamide ligase [Methanosarcinales archaeon]|nr:formate--phosphoribosylaminoimidazolecarboxamide ligase [Methanosarcinales archaeon]